MASNSSTYWCSPRLLKVLYTSMILLLWVCRMYLCCSVERKDDIINTLTMNIIITVMSITIITFPFIIYIGGCVVSLPNTYKDAATPRASEVENEEK